MNWKAFILSLLLPISAFGAVPAVGNFDTNNFRWTGQAMQFQQAQALGTLSLTNNGLTVTRPTGATSFVWLAQATIKGVINDVRNYGVIGVGDETAKIQAAMDALGPSGGNLTFPGIGPIGFSGLVIRSPINWVGPGSSKVFDNSFTNYFYSTDPTKFMIQVGDGTNLVRGATIGNSTFIGTNTDNGIFFNSAFECSMFNDTIWRFKTNLAFKASTLQPCSVISLINLWLQNSTADNSRSIWIGQQPSQTAYTTDIEFFRVHGNGVSSGANNYFAEFDGAVPTFIAGYMDLSGGDGHGILLSKHGAGVPDPYIISSSLVLDGGGAVVIEIDPSYAAGYPYDKIQGTYSSSGSLKKSDGTLWPLPNSAFASSVLFNPRINSGMNFTPSGLYTNNGTTTIETDANGALQLNSTNQVTITGGSGLGVNIGPSLSVPGSVSGQIKPQGMSTSTIPQTDGNGILTNLTNQANSVLVNNGSQPIYQTGPSGDIVIQDHGSTNWTFHFVNGSLNTLTHSP